MRGSIPSKLKVRRFKLNTAPGLIGVMKRIAGLVCLSADFID